MNLSANPIYGPPPNLPEIAIRISTTGTETIENHPKPIQPSNDFIRNHRKIIDIMIRMPEITMRIRCIFPRKVTNFPSSSKGKNRVTSNPMKVLIRNRTGPTIEPSFSIPQSKLNENANDNALQEIKNELNNNLLGALTAKRELTSSRM